MAKSDHAMGAAGELFERDHVFQIPEPFHWAES
jgi:hypothetical protein